ncbi:Nucleotide-binding universal stress protein, UspA family [Halomicrobium zhouii]|uniref:Nucleotide-binding universal stress protein, UspA family n=1 Tax=Halomicrobium zhouii TaxID=767519 RepID=A0A1I6K7Z2_9EURY|nr:universal stress protein [Halomicrobium zhouii]SFR87336.1 Nucleotide-binding universal stress protein, UspA family [Halomicrobium zhouii]
MYERILFPTDGSAGTAHVALQAIDLAQQYGATIHVLHVVDEDLRGLVEGLSGEDALETEGKRALERIEQMAEAHGVDVTTAIEEGDPAESIVAYADDIDADLIVAGTHGRTGIKRRVIGSVAERIVRNATCPVMTVRLGETDVTVDSKEEARELAAAALERDGLDATVTGVERQVSVWVVDAESDDSSSVVYVDPVTQRTSVIDRD